MYGPLTVLHILGHKGDLGLWMTPKLLRRLQFEFLLILIQPFMKEVKQTSVEQHPSLAVQKTAT